MLSGEQEAYYAALGVLNEVPLARGYVVDIGGGSVQVAQVRERRFRRGQSVPLGTLALTERFVNHDPIEPAEYEAVQAEINHQFETISWLQKKQAKPERRLVGLGGTIRNLAKMEAARQNYPLNTLHGFSLGRASVDESICLLRQLPVAERQKLPGLTPDRSDIILPGAMVLQAIMERLKVDALTVSMNGLREGLFYEHFWDHLS